MRILTRYILKEVFGYFLLGLLIFTFTVFIPQLGHLLELVARHNLSVADIFMLFLLPLPRILVLTLPMSVLVGTLIGLSRMSADGEVIAVRASGIGLAQLVHPVMILAVAGWGVATWISLFLAPQAARKLYRMELSVKTSQAPYEIQPRVFLEQIPNRLIYLGDIIGSRSEWQGVFLADTTQPDLPKVTLAESGRLVNDARENRLVLHLERGATHEIDPQHPEQYSVASFAKMDIPIAIDESTSGPVESSNPASLSSQELLRATRDPLKRQAAGVELHYRLALPVAALVLTLVGIPFGLHTRKGGKAVGVILTVLLVFIYYIVMAFGLGFAKQGRLDPRIGLWLANAIFAATGIWMLVQMRRARTRLQFIQDWFGDLRRRFDAQRSARRRLRSPHALLRQNAPGNRFLLLLDLYVIQGWLFYSVILLVGLTGIYVIFDFFQLLGDIIRNHIPARVVFDYYRFLLPQIIYFMLPLSILVATLVNFGLLTKTNQITAIKSAGISLYRIAVPILLLAAATSAGMFLLQDKYLPQSNQREDTLRNQIKGRPPQTHYRPGLQWIFGQSNRIYNYRFFDSDRDVFANLSVFEFDPKTFRLTRRIYAARTFWEPGIREWILENGWNRDLEGDQMKAYLRFSSVATFEELTEDPGYFKKEVKPSAQMNALELRRYINDLSQSGFDVVRLSVQLYRKFSFPLIALVVALIGIPFSFTTGSKGALSGIALSLGIAILYWSISSLFEAMGNLSQLPPLVAAWTPDALFGLGGIYLMLRIRT